MFVQAAPGIALARKGDVHERFDDQFMAERFEGCGGDLRLFTTLEGLYMEDGAVVGVALRDSDDRSVAVRALNGVVLSTGGMGGSRAMLARYCPTALEVCKFSSAGVQDLGEGIRMGLGAGPRLAAATGSTSLTAVSTAPTGTSICTVPQCRWRANRGRAIADGTIKSADTIEELAEQLGLDPVKIAAAVDEWNALCEAGTDPEAKMPDEFLYPIAQPPFYGMAPGTFIFATHCGLTVNGDGRVLDTQGNPIPGLYASGCTVSLPMPQANGSCCFAAASAWLAAGTALGL